MKQDPREDGRKARLVKQALELKQQEEVEEQGKDYKRFKAMEKNVEQAEWERNKREEARQRQVNGFTSRACLFLLFLSELTTRSITRL